MKNSAYKNINSNSLESSQEFIAFSDKHDPPPKDLSDLCVILSAELGRDISSNKLLKQRYGQKTASTGRANARRLAKRYAYV